jgi:DNA primase
MGTSLSESQMEMLWRLHPEPTLCFDGDRAGIQAASRAMDRALPLLRAGRSFRFCHLSGGKDPDEILREQGASALKGQLAATTTFVEALFIRERDATVLDTPERRAGLKQRLRERARTIAEPDLAAAYREALLEKFDSIFAYSRPASPQPPFATRRRPGGWRDLAAPLPTLPTPEGRAAAKQLSGMLSPIAAALAKWAIADPPVLDDHLEALEQNGFGDPALTDLCRQIIRLRLDSDHLDTEALRRHLTESGFAALLIDIDRAATHAGAPFFKSDVTLAAARSQWSYAFEVLNRLAALEIALTAAKLALGGGGVSALSGLKSDRDQLRRAVKSGTIWAMHEPS